MTDWFASITCYLGRQIHDCPPGRPSSHLEALSWRSAGLSVVHFDPNYIYGSCTHTHTHTLQRPPSSSRLRCIILQACTRRTDWWVGRRKGLTSPDWVTLISGRGPPSSSEQEPLQGRVAVCCPTIRWRVAETWIVIRERIPPQRDAARSQRSSAAVWGTSQRPPPVNCHNGTSDGPPTTPTPRLNRNRIASYCDIISRKRDELHPQPTFHPHSLHFNIRLQPNVLVMGRCRYLTSVSVFGIGISKYRDIGSVFRYFSWSTLRVTDKLRYRCWFIVCSSMRRLSSVSLVCPRPVSRG